MLFYVTRDIERALGLPDTPQYTIISNATTFAKQIAQHRTHIVLIDEGKTLDTIDVLKCAAKQEILPKNASVVVFKNTAQIESFCHAQGWQLLNPKAALANRVEEKISQIEWLGPLATYLPPHRVDLLKNIPWNGKPFILQFNRAHTGSGTLHIRSQEALVAIQKKFPHRPVRVSEWIDGPVFTSNNIVTKNKTLCGNISYQITGLPPFTDQPFATIGNDWGLAEKLLTREQRYAYCDIVIKIGGRLLSNGWRGLFGTDMILDEINGRMYLIEINARQPASATYESQLQQNADNGESEAMTVFEAHIAALLGRDTNQKKITRITDGAQIIVRNQTSHAWEKERIIDELERNGMKVLSYDNTEAGSDYLRIQSKKSFMDAHGTFNKDGERIIEVLKKNERHPPE